MVQKNYALPSKEKSFGVRFIIDIKKHPYVYMLALPVLIYYILFCYVPMFGIVIAFKDYSPMKGVFASDWADMCGFEHFINFVKDPYFARILRNTLLISIYSIVFGFPSPIIFAILLNEIKSNKFKRTVQTVTYLPHFISMMVVCGMITTFVGREGFINDIIVAFGGERSNLIARPELFRAIYVISDIWQGMGWNSIVYIAALTAIDQQLYEAATIDGAGVLRKIWHISIPGIMPTVIIMLIMRLGSLLSVGYEKIILLYSEMTYETADVISSYVYRRGILNTDYSFSAAVGLMNAVVNFIVIYISNRISRRLSETSLW